MVDCCPQQATPCWSVLNFSMHTWGNWHCHDMLCHAVQNGHHKIMIQTVDINVELWLVFTGKSLRYLAAHEISAALGPEKRHNVQSIPPTKAALRSMLRGQSIKTAMYGVRCWCQRQSFLLLADGVGQRHLRVTMNHSGHACLMQANPALNLFPANGRRVVLSSVSAKKLP